MAPLPQNGIYFLLGRPHNVNDESMEYDRCGNCNEEVTPDSDFCPHCGVLFDGQNVVCDTHTQNPATGICIICRKLVCELCGKQVHQRTFCSDHKSVEVQQDWAKVFASSEVYDSNLVKSVLESSGFHVQIQNFGSIGYVWEGGGDSPLSRSALNKPAKVLVPIPEYLEAMKTIEEWNSTADQSKKGNDDEDS